MEVEPKKKDPFTEAFGKSVACKRARGSWQLLGFAWVGPLG